MAKGARIDANWNQYLRKRNNYDGITVDEASFDNLIM